MTTWHIPIFLIIVAVTLIRNTLDYRQWSGVDYAARLNDSLRQNGPGAAAMLFVLQLLGVDILPMRLDPETSTIVRSAGIGLAIVAGIGMTWPRLQRWSSWAGPATVPTQIPGHFLATTGPYRFVRHPYYAACLVGIIAIELVTLSWLCVIVVPLAILLAGVPLREEEEQLEQVYGDEYRKYAERTWRLIPLIY